MNTKKCKFCGWVYPITQPGLRCIICGQPFEQVACSICGEVVPVDRLREGRATCKACKSKYSLTFYYRRMAKLEAQFDEWLDKVKSVPKNYPPLTEEQWIEACNFFNGCARCGSDEIDTRGFFVGAKLGGRYCDWNIIPLCEHCAGAWDLSRSAFRYITRRAKTDKSPEYLECLEKITSYLGGKLDVATGTNKPHD